MLNPIEQSVADFLFRQVDYDASKPLLLAVSGGADSVAMLHILCKIFEEHGINTKPAVCHVNHHLRPSSDLEQEFVENLCRNLGLAFSASSIEVKAHAAEYKVSVETAARELRRMALVEVAGKYSCSTIATAHHTDDNAETIVHRLLRGTAFRGLCGIKPVQVFDDMTIIRPLLCLNRKQIVQYCTGNKIEWCHDESNDDINFKRNFIRHRLLPALQRQSDSSLADQAVELSSSAIRLYDRIEKYSETLWPRIVLREDPCRVVIDRTSFNNLSPLIKSEILNRSFKTISLGLGKITQNHYCKIFTDSLKPFSAFQLPGDVTVTIQHGKIIVEKNSPLKPVDSVELQYPQVAQFGQYRIKTSRINIENADFEKFYSSKTPLVEWFDLDKINFPVMVRRRKTGDKFVPFGAVKSKSVARFLASQHLPRHLRENILIFTDQNRIIWAAPVRCCNQTRISPQTRDVLQIELVETAQ